MALRGRTSAGVWLWPTVAVLMLVGMGVEAAGHVKPADADAHQAACKKAIENFPMTIYGADGVWVGSDAPVPESAVTLLRPNVILSRQYVKQDDGQCVSLLIVDCTDARDLQGHYPPHCYPSQGQMLIPYDQTRHLDGQERVWHLPDMDVRGMEYHFAPDSETEQEKVVYNFFVTPRVPGAIVSHKELDGVICTDIDSVYKSGEDYQRRYFGAAEFQLVVVGSQMSRPQRDQALVDLLGPNENVIRALENRPDRR